MKFSVISLGCKVNSYETEVLINDLNNKGWEYCLKDDDVDVIIINTCTVTNMGDKTIFIAIPTIQDTFEYLEVLPNKEVFIYLNNYRYCFFVCANEQQESYTYNFKIENREEELKYASSNDFQKMPNLETNKSYLFSNAEYDKKWFKINIESKGEYKFDTSASNFYIQIKTINNEYIDRASAYKLDIGEYIIEIGYSGDNNKYSIDQTTIIFKQIS